MTTKHVPDEESLQEAGKDALALPAVSEKVTGSPPTVATKPFNVTVQVEFVPASIVDDVQDIESVVGAGSIFKVTAFEEVLPALFESPL